MASTIARIIIILSIALIVSEAKSAVMRPRRDETSEVGNILDYLKDLQNAYSNSRPRYGKRNMIPRAFFPNDKTDIDWYDVDLGTTR